MSAVREVLAWLCAYGPTMLLGVTIVLLGGTVAMALHRAPAQRRRLGVATAFGALVYLAVAAAPLPRCTLRDVQIETIGPTMQASLLPVPDADARAARLLAAMRELDVEVPPAGANDLTVAAAVGGRAVPAAFVVSEPTGLVGMLGWLRTWPWQLLFASVYALGVAFMLLRGLGGYLRLHRLLATCRAVPLPPGVHLPRGTRLLAASLSVRPFCAGLWQPIVVLPRELLEPARAAEASAVLRHEAAHVRAGDSRVQTLLALLAVPLFCHPLFWWLCREVRFCSELLADDAAAADGRNHYARALIDLAERDQPQLVAAGTVAVFHRPSEFYRRIQMLLQREAPLCTSTTRLRRFTHAFAMLCLVGTAASLFGVPAAAQDPTGRTMRKENAELRETIETLRAELGDLRQQIQELGEVRARAEHTRTLEALLRGANENKPRNGTDLQELFGHLGQAPQADQGGALQALLHDRNANEQAQAIIGDTAQDHTNVPRALEQAGQDPTFPPVAPPTTAKVPVLSDLPLIGNLFQAGQAPAPGMQPPRTYTVRKGDTLEGIAQKTTGSANGIEPLMELNPGIDPTRLRIGQSLALPTPNASPNLFPPQALPGMGPSTTPVAGSPPGLIDPFARPTLPPSQIQPGFPTPLPTDLPAALAPPQPSGASALADLTSRYLDLQAELEIAEITAAETKALAESGHASQHEARQAAVTLRSLHKKFQISQRLIDGEIVATEQELAWIEQKRKESDPTECLRLDMQASRARTRLEALHSVK